MKKLLSHPCAGVAIALWLAIGAHGTTAFAQSVRYSVRDLGVAGGAGSSAGSINEAGVAVGWIETALHETRAVRTGADGSFEMLPGLESIMSDAEGINVFGDIAGSFQVSAYPNWTMHAMRYTQAGGLEDLGSFGGSSYAYGINRHGQVSGSSYSSGWPSFIRAFIATPGRWLQDLGTLSGQPYASSFAGGINDAGQVAGHSETANGRWHAFRYVPGTGLQDLGTPADYSSFASKINASGQVVGRVYTDSGEHAFRYTDGIGLQDLDGLGARSGAVGINDSGDVVGYFSYPNQPSRAFLYTDAEGMIDLNSTIDPASGWILGAAYGINVAGEIVGVGTYNGQVAARAFKLTPIPPDTTPPLIRSATPDPAVIWPPTHLMVDVSVGVDATDDTDPAPQCSLTGVSSNEAIAPDDAFITAALSAQLRAERDATRSGREYYLAVTCSDASGNQAHASVVVRVPHDMDH